VAVEPDFGHQTPDRPLGRIRTHGRTFGRERFDSTGSTVDVADAVLAERTDLPGEADGRGADETGHGCDANETRRGCDASETRHGWDR
jgi:hypothetical protein